MSLKRKLEGEVEVHEGAGDLYHDIFMSKPHELSKISPHFIQGCDLHHGSFGSPGFIVEWTYTIGGKQYSSKNMIEEIDEEKKLVRQRAVEGDLLKEYKSIVGTTQVIPKGKETSIVKVSIVYEKLHSGIPEPSDLLDSLLAAAVDAHDHHHHHGK